MQFIKSDRAIRDIALPNNAKQIFFRKDKVTQSSKVLKYIPSDSAIVYDTTTPPSIHGGNNLLWEKDTNPVYLQLEPFFIAENNVKYDRHCESYSFLLELPCLLKQDTLQLSKKITKLYTWIHKYDLSQEAYDISFVCDSSTNNLVRINTVAIPFDKFPDFTYLHPQPDSIGKKVIYYTTPCKIKQIREEGVQAFVKYPERNGMQTARIFILTMIMSLLLTGIINQIIKLYKDLKVEKFFKNKTKSCAISAPHCNECPLKSQCEQFTDNLQPSTNIPIKTTT